MILPVAGQFMPRIHDPADQGRVPGRDTAEGEERPRCATVGEYLKDAVCIRLDPAFMAGPVGPVDDGGECMDVEMLFHVDGQRAGQRVDSFFQETSFAHCPGSARQHFVLPRIR